MSELPGEAVDCTTQERRSVAVSDAGSLAVSQHLEVAVSDVAFGGEGVARAGDFVVFVPFVLPGELAEVEVAEVKKRYARARLIRVRQVAPERVAPKCRYFGQCGGCQYQHIEYAAQLRLKEKQVRDLLERLGGFPGTAVEPVIPCPQPYGYRNRIMIRSQWDKYKQGLNLGFLRADSRLVVDIDQCELAVPAINRELLRVRAHPPPKGGLKVVVREMPEGWEVPPDAFFQNNSVLLPQLVGVARECLRSSGSRFLVDAYCGVGFFGLELADLVVSFVGVEYDRQAVRAARRNAHTRGCLNGEYLQGRTEDLLPGLLERFSASETTVILDPPRTGCAAETLQQLRQVRPRQIIYVSCHPATFARDLRRLCAEEAYRLKKVIPLDMFPQTQHIECVADLRGGTDPAPTPVDEARTIGSRQVSLAKQ